jgi:ADP-heptose:LPS heptosyltransferase
MDRIDAMLDSIDRIHHIREMVSELPDAGTVRPDDLDVEEKLLQVLEAVDALGENEQAQAAVEETLEAIRAADVLFCNDSGPMHIAAALGTPVTAMFAPTDPDRTGPFAKNAVVLVPENLPCMKCFKYECEKPLCHQAIPAEKAAQTLFQILTGEHA